MFSKSFRWYPSNQPFSSSYLRSGGRGSRLSKLFVLQPSNIFQLFLVNPEALPKPDEIYNLYSVFWVYPRVSYELDVLGKPLMELSANSFRTTS